MGSEYRVTKSATRLSDEHTHTHIYIYIYTYTYIYTWEAPANQLYMSKIIIIIYFKKECYVSALHCTVNLPNHLLSVLFCF